MFESVKGHLARIFGWSKEHAATMSESDVVTKLAEMEEIKTEVVTEKTGTVAAVETVESKVETVTTEAGVNVKDTKEYQELQTKVEALTDQVAKIAKDSEETIATLKADFGKQVNELKGKSKETINKVESSTGATKNTGKVPVSVAAWRA